MEQHKDEWLAEYYPEPEEEFVLWALADSVLKVGRGELKPETD